MSVRGLVMEVDKKRLVVMLPGGQFRRVTWTGPSVRVGQEIHVPARKLYPYTWLAAPMAAGLAALYFALIAPAVSAAAFVSVDINPSVNLEISGRGRVMAAVGLDAAGAKLLKQDPVTGRWVVSAVSDLVRQAAQDGYVKHSTAVVIGAVFKSTRQKWFAALPTAAGAVLKRDRLSASVVTVSGVSRAIVASMKKPTVSVGRYLLWRRHSARVRTRLSVGQVRTMPVTRLVHRIRLTKKNPVSHEVVSRDLPKRRSHHHRLPKLPVSTPSMAIQTPTVSTGPVQTHHHGHPQGQNNGKGKAHGHGHQHIPSVSVSINPSLSGTVSPSGSVTPSSSTNSPPSSSGQNHGHKHHAHSSHKTPSQEIPILHSVANPVNTVSSILGGL